MSLYEQLSVSCPDAPADDTRTQKTGKKSDPVDEFTVLASLAAVAGRTTITKVDRETTDESHVLGWPGLGI